MSERTDLERLATTIYCGNESQDAEWCNLPEGEKDAWRAACENLLPEIEAEIESKIEEAEAEAEGKVKDLEEEIETLKKTCREAAQKIRSFMEAENEALTTMRTKAERKREYEALRDEVIQQVAAIEKATEEE